MKSNTKILVVLMVIVSLGLTACAGSQPTPTPVPPTPTPSITEEDLIGIWYGYGPLQFNEDGTYRNARAITWLETAPDDVGQFRLEGTTLTFISSNDSPNCRGQSGSYQVELTEQGQLQFVLIEDPCQPRVNRRAGRSWDRVEP